MTKHLVQSSSTLILTLAAMMAAGSAARAHPHVWVTVAGQLIYAPDGSVTGMRDDWTFDDMFSAFATQGIKPKQPGAFSRQELAPLAQVNVTSLKDFGYFTFGKVNGQKVELSDPTDYYADYNSKDTELTLHFTLPFKAPIKARELNLEIYDPEFFVDFSFKKTKNPVALVGAPAGCKLTANGPQAFSVVPGQQLGEDFFNQLTAADNWGAQFANKISVKCP